MKPPEKHICEDHRVYLERCDDCAEKGIECPLSKYGICSICGRLLGDDEEE